MQSRLGLGTLRLPIVKNGSEPDENEIQKIVDTAVQNGIKYFDCAPTYCMGRCEQVLGKFLSAYREKVEIGSKVPLEALKKPGDVRKYLMRSLERLGTDYLDCYYFWAVKKVSYEQKALHEGYLEEIWELKKSGVIKNMGFSYHDEAEFIPWILESAEQRGVYFDMLLCQYNLLDRSMEQSIPYAKERGIKIAVMGAAAGGKLNVFPAYRFVLKNRNVDIMLTGADTEGHLREIIELERSFGRGNEEQIEEIIREKSAKSYLQELYCTGCGYCMPCLRGVKIPQYLSVWQKLLSEEVLDAEKKRQLLEEYIRRYGEPWRLCSRCKKCEKYCPQGVEIVQWIEKGELKDESGYYSGK